MEGEDRGSGPRFLFETYHKSTKVSQARKKQARRTFNSNKHQELDLGNLGLRGQDLGKRSE